MNRTIVIATLLTAGAAGIAQADHGEVYPQMGGPSLVHGGGCSPYQGLWDGYCFEKRHGRHFQMPILHLPPVYGGHIHYGGAMQARGYHGAADRGCHSAADAYAGDDHGSGDSAWSESAPQLAPMRPEPLVEPPTPDKSLDDERLDSSARRRWWPQFRALPTY